MAARLAAVGRGLVDGEVRADVELRHRFEDRRGLDHFQIHAPLVADLVVQPGPRVVRPGVPAIAAGNVRA